MNLTEFGGGRLPLHPLLKQRLIQIPITALKTDELVDIAERAVDITERAQNRPGIKFTSMQRKKARTWHEKFAQFYKFTVRVSLTGGFVLSLPMHFLTLSATFDVRI